MRESDLSRRASGRLSAITGRGLLEAASPDLVELLAAVASVARHLERPVWMVGGAVRDLSLGIDSRDLDLVVLSHAAVFARELATRVGGTAQQNERFLSFSFSSASDFEVDVGRARAETYSRRAALPVVRPGTLVEDLQRRDYSVNAIALCLSDGDHRILDPCGGLQDLQNRQLTVLHDRSFIDDPTRIFRGLRLGDRLNLKFHPNTEELARRPEALVAARELTGPRLRHELRLMLEEPGAAPPIFSRLSALGLESAISNGLVVDDLLLARLDSLCDRDRRPAMPEPRWLAGLAAVTWDLETAERSRLLDRLQLRRRERSLVEGLREALENGLERAGGLNSSYDWFKLGDALGPFGRAIGRCWGTPSLARYLETEWPRHSRISLSVSGADLTALGFQEGSDVGAALDQTLRARLAGTIEPTQELEFAANWLRRRKASGTRAPADGRVDADTGGHRGGGRRDEKGSS